MDRQLHGNFIREMSIPESTLKSAHAQCAACSLRSPTPSAKRLEWGLVKRSFAGCQVPPCHCLGQSLWSLFCFLAEGTGAVWESDTLSLQIFDQAREEDLFWLIDSIVLSHGLLNPLLSVGDRGNYLLPNGQEAEQDIFPIKYFEQDPHLLNAIKLWLQQQIN